MIERRGRARAFLAVVGSVAALPGARRHAVEIGGVTIESVCGRERRGSLRSEVAGIARAQSDNGEPPAHGRPSQPGTSTTTKYGASSSGLALSGTWQRRPWCALDVDGAGKPAAPFQRAAQFRQMAADLHDHGGIGLAETARQLGFRQRRSARSVASAAAPFATEPATFVHVIHAKVCWRR